MSAQDKITPTAAPTGCGIWPVPNRNLKRLLAGPGEAAVMDVSGLV